MLVEAWREIVRHGLYQEINIKCLEDMAKNGCLMKSDDAWQMVTEILSKLRFIITYDLQALCLQLIKLLCDINDTKRAMIIFDQMQFQLNGFVSMDILDQLLSGLLATSQWETAKRVVCRLLQNRLRPKEYVVGQILHKLYYDFDSQSIFELLKQLEKFGMKRKHLVFQDALHLLRKLVLDKNYSHRSTSLKRNPEMMKLVEPQTLKELVDAIWDCPNGTHVGRMCAEFFVAWSPEGCYSPVLHQEICGYVTKNSDFQIKVFADFISEFDKASKVSTVVRKASIELLNGLLLEALALGNKDLAIQIIFPSMESRCILIHDRGLSCLIDVLWNAGTRKWPVARRLFDSRSGLYFSKHKVRPFEVLIHETSTSAEIYFTIEKLLFSHERLFHKRTCFYNVRVIIRRATQPKGLNKFKFKYDCINRVTNIIENRFQPPLKINRIYPSTDTSSQDVIIVSYNSIHTCLCFQKIFFNCI
ncbi:uncharacterized protein [Antedon mediterranea]|uniref:uncharacterized protein isoform X2 n=1 Tax=Antedon mediterranea TaxID=105859 RepID=UPI003AF423A3